MLASLLIFWTTYLFFLLLARLDQPQRVPGECCRSVISLVQEFHCFEDVWILRQCLTSVCLLPQSAYKHGRDWAIMSHLVWRPQSDVFLCNRVGRLLLLVTFLNIPDDRGFCCFSITVVGLLAGLSSTTCMQKGTLLAVGDYSDHWYGRWMLVESPFMILSTSRKVMMSTHYCP